MKKRKKYKPRSKLQKLWFKIYGYKGRIKGMQTTLRDISNTFPELNRVGIDSIVSNVDYLEKCIDGAYKSRKRMKNY